MMPTLYQRLLRWVEGESFECLLYQLWMVGYMPTMVVTGNGELGLDSGEQA